MFNWFKKKVIKTINIKVIKPIIDIDFKQYNKCIE